MPTGYPFLLLIPDRCRAINKSNRVDLANETRMFLAARYIACLHSGILFQPGTFLKAYKKKLLHVHSDSTTYAFIQTLFPSLKLSEAAGAGTGR